MSKVVRLHAYIHHLAYASTLLVASLWLIFPRASLQKHCWFGRSTYDICINETHICNYISTLIWIQRIETAIATSTSTAIITPVVHAMIDSDLLWFICLIILDHLHGIFTSACLRRFRIEASKQTWGRWSSSSSSSLHRVIDQNVLNSQQ